MTSIKQRIATVAPPTLQKQLEVLAAARALLGEEDGAACWRREEIAALRRDYGELVLMAQELWRQYDPRLRSHVIKYDPDQPRVPAGSSHGGEWTSGGGGSSGEPATDGGGTPQAHPGKGPQYAALDTGTRSDATPIPPGVQYAGGIEDDENENRSGGPRFDGTPAQQLRQSLADIEWRDALSQVRRYDPTWQPGPSLYDPNTIEGDIARLEAETKEAKEYLERLRGLATPRPPFFRGDREP